MWNFLFGRRSFASVVFVSLAPLFPHRTATQHGPHVPLLLWWACDVSRPITVLQSPPLSDWFKDWTRNPGRVNMSPFMILDEWTLKEKTILLGWDQYEYRFRAARGHLPTPILHPEPEVEKDSLQQGRTKPINNEKQRQDELKWWERAKWYYLST